MFEPSPPVPTWLRARYKSIFRFALTFIPHSKNWALEPISLQMSEHFLLYCTQIMCCFRLHAQNFQISLNIP
jgi:hypothetical protein